MTNFFHQHNLVEPEKAERERRFGIRASLPAGDPFTRLVGSDWTGEEWFPTRIERDAAYENKRTRHGFYRIGDEVSVIYEKIDPA